MLASWWPRAQLRSPTEQPGPRSWVLTKSSHVTLQQESITEFQKIKNFRDHLLWPSHFTDEKPGSWHVTCVIGRHTVVVWVTQSGSRQHLGGFKGTSARPCPRSLLREWPWIWESMPGGISRRPRFPPHVLYETPLFGVGSLEQDGMSLPLCSFSGTSTTKYHTQRSWNNRQLWLPGSGGWKAKVDVSAGLLSSESVGNNLFQATPWLLLICCNLRCSGAN